MQRKKKAVTKRPRKAGTPRKTTRKTTRRKTTAAKTTGSRKAKYKVGDFVYSPLNPTEKRQVCGVRVPKTKTAFVKYQLTLSDPKGRPKKSKWVNEGSIRKTKRV